jgi:hypothetical protein
MGITRDITIGITGRTMIGTPAPTTGLTIGSTGIGDTAGITANTMDLIGERTMTGTTGRIITIIDDNDAHTVARPFNQLNSVQAIRTAVISIFKPR